MEKFHIALTENEKALVGNIDFESFTHESYIANQEPVLSLLKSLSDRNAIPEQRLKYWNDPEYNIGGYKNTSKKGTFERNGKKGGELYTHPPFLKYLRYFLYGADLPDQLIKQFRIGCKEGHVNFDYVTSGDIEPICKSARKVARIAIRDYKLEKRHITEELYKLCLDMELDNRYARMVRNDVATVR